MIGSDPQRAEIAFERAADHRVVGADLARVRIRPGHRCGIDFRPADLLGQLFAERAQIVAAARFDVVELVDRLVADRGQIGTPEVVDVVVRGAEIAFARLEDRKKRVEVLGGNGRRECQLPQAVAVERKEERVFAARLGQKRLTITQKRGRLERECESFAVRSAAALVVENRRRFPMRSAAGRVQTAGGQRLLQLENEIPDRLVGRRRDDDARDRNDAILEHG